MSPNAIIGRVSVWIDKYSGIGPTDLIAPPENIAARVVYSAHDMSAHGYTKVGHADVVLHFDDPQAVVAAHVDSLKAQIAKERAESEAKVTNWTRQINELLALPMEAAS